MAIQPYGPQDSVVYTLSSPDGDTAVFNDPADANYVGFAQFTGLDDAEVRESIEDRSGDHGAIQGMNWRGRRPITATIEIVPTSTVDRTEKWALLRRAVNSLHENGTLSWQPDGGPAVQIGVRKNGPIRREDASGLVAKCQIALMASDPDILSQALHTDSGTSGADTWENQGDTPAAPVVTITAATGAAVAVENLTTGEKLDIPVFTLSTYIADYVSDFLSFSSSYTGASTIWVDTSDNVYICGGTPGANTVSKYNSAGTLQWTSGTFGTGNGQFNVPMGVCTDTSGNVYVADTFNSRVQKLNSSGVYQGQVAVSTWPTSITCNNGSTVYVAGGGFTTHEIKKINGAAMTVSSTFGTLGTGGSQFQYITGMAVDSSGNLFVADSHLNRIQKFNSSDVYQTVFGSLGAGDGQFSAPKSLMVDTSNKLYVLDAGNGRIQRFNTSNVFEAKYGTAGTGDGQFDNPNSMALARDLATASVTLYVEDNQARVQKFVASSTRTAIFDFAKRTVTSSGVNAYDLIYPLTSDWWKLQPGNNSINFIGTSSYSAEWRDAWL